MLRSLCLAVAVAQAPSPAALALTGEKITLDNGLVVIASVDHSVPGVAVDLWYRVGSRDEEPGRTGFAHLFEHLMFMGAQYAPYPKFDSIMEAAGGVNNASTSQDVTNYYEVGPSNLLETFLWLEADRLATLDRVMDAEKLASQRLIVQNERRQSYENRPYGMADLAVEEQVYPQGHPYSWSPIGSHRDLEAATVDDVLRFFRTYYVPNNAVLAVVGDVDPSKVFALARQYLAFIPRRELPRKPAPAPWSRSSEKRIELTDKVEAEKALVAWPSPAAQTQGDAEADVLASVLARGKASRLYQRLVHRDQLATSVSAQQSSMELGSIFSIEAMAAPGHTSAELLGAIDDELGRLAASGPTQPELDSARARFESDVARRLQNLQSRAQLLAGYEVAYGDPNALTRDLARYAQATPASLTAAARALFVPGRLVVKVRPEAAPQAPSKTGGGR
jgi:predicted Zn-dependent peptidase